MTTRTQEVPEIGSTVYANGQPFVVEEAEAGTLAGGRPTVSIIVHRPKGSKRYLGVYDGTTPWGGRWARITMSPLAWEVHLLPETDVSRVTVGRVSPAQPQEF